VPERALLCPGNAVVDVYSNWLQQVAEQRRGGAEGQRRHVTTLQSSVFGCKRQLTGGQSTGVCAEGKLWQLASLCRPVAARWSMTLMTTTSRPHRGKAVAATASLYGDNSG